MIQLYRARLALLAGAAVAAAVLALQLPIGEILHQRSQITAVSGALATINARDRQLQRDVASLGRSSTVAAIAHQDYGLVEPGQRAYIVLPAKGSGPGRTSTLAERPLPQADLLPTDASSLVRSAAVRTADGTTATGSLWSRVAERLEFWRWAL